MKEKLLKIGLAFMMAFGIHATTLSSLSATDTTVLPDGTYTVPTKLMNASNITNASMAGGALANEGKIVIENGNRYLIAEFKTLDFGGMGTTFGNASNIKYYTDYTKKQSLDAETLSMRNDAKVTTATGVLENQEAVKEVKIPLSNTDTGIYINLFVDFMNYAPDAYISFDLADGIKSQLATAITKAKAYQEKDYTLKSFTTLKTAIKNAESVYTNDGSTEQELTEQLVTLNTAMTQLESIYNLADGQYKVNVGVLKADSDASSMAASAVKSAIIKAENNQLTVTLEMGSVSMGNVVMFIDKMEYENSDGSYNEAAITAHDEKGNVSQVQFILPENLKTTNIKFYYGGSTRGASARLSLGLDNPIAVNTSHFETDGTYNVSIDLWHESKDTASMASSAIDKKATVVVKNGKATMYITSKKMTMGTIVAYLQDLKIKDGATNPTLASVVSRDVSGNPIMFAFELPHENEYINVLVNPKVAIMGNQDIAARFKVDYATVKKISDSTNVPTLGSSTENPTEDKDTSTITPTQPTTTTNPTQSTTPSQTNPVKTDDTTDSFLISIMLISSLAFISYYTKKKLCK